MRTVTIAICLCALTGFPIRVLAQSEPSTTDPADPPSTLTDPSPEGIGREGISASEVSPPSSTETPPTRPRDEAAGEPEEESAPSGFARVLDTIHLQLHGFVSQGYIASANNAFLARSRHGGSFDLSEGGINVTTEPVERLRIGVQLFARRVGTTGNFNAKFDWFYVDYRFRDWLGLRAGRTKIPFGLYNEINDVDVARVPILLPQSIYPSANRDFLLAQTGGEIYGRIPMGSAGTLEYRLYGGTIQLDRPTTTVGSPIAVNTLENRYLVGGRVMWELPVDGLRIGASAQTLRLQSDLVVANMPVSINLPVVLWVGSAEFARGPWLIAAEYSRWHQRLTSSNTAIYPNGAAVNERAYVMGSYQVTDWFHPGLYYSVLFPYSGSVLTDTVANRHGRAAQSHDVAATLRFDINDNWLVKVEGHYMRGTAGLASNLNGNVPLTNLPWNTAVLIVRTTGYF